MDRDDQLEHLLKTQKVLESIREDVAEVIRTFGPLKDHFVLDGLTKQVKDFRTELQAMESRLGGTRVQADKMRIDAIEQRVDKASDVIREYKREVATEMQRLSKLVQGVAERVAAIESTLECDQDREQ